MTTHYHDPGDFKLLRELKALAPVAEAVFVAAALRAGAAATHGTLALKLFDGHTI